MDAAESMDLERGNSSSQLFTLRLWRAEPGEGAGEWRGQLRHVTSGQIYYFRDWQAFLTLLLKLLADLEPHEQG